MCHRRVYRLAWALFAFTVVAAAADAAGIYRLDPGGGVAGVAAVGPEFVARNAWVSDAGANGDGVVSPGENVFVRISMQNAGGADARNTRIALATTDPDVDISTDAFRDAVWSAGRMWEPGWNATIAATSAPHDVTAVVTVTADNGGPWLFILTFAVAEAPLSFAKVDTRIEDPAPDGDGDGQAEPGERIRVGVRLRNDGATEGSGVRVALRVLDADFAPVVAEAVHTSWPAGEERDTLFLVDIADAAHTHDVPVFISVTADGVDPWHFSVLIPVVGQDPEFELRSSWLFDPAPGGNRDGRAVPGERVLPRVRLKNIGTADAQNVEVTIAVADRNITVVGGIVAHAVWPVGEARNNAAPAFDVAPDAQPGIVTATVTVAADGAGPWQFEVPFTIAVPDVSFALESSWVFDPRPGGNRDHRANRGESILPRVRVRNVGSDEAQGVTVLLASADPDVTVTAGEIAYAEWPAGGARNNTGFALDISPDAQPRDATLSVTVTTAHGGPWQFSVALPIFYAPVEFIQRSSWVFDPNPGGDRDGQAEAGERVRPRLRLLHVGTEEARNVRVTLATDDPEVTVVQAEAAHETWTPGEARNSGFVLDIAPDAAVHDITFRATIRADSGGPWDITFTLPIAGPAAAFAFQGTTRGTVEVYGTSGPGPRLRHIGTEPLTNVRVTLVSGDPDVTVPATHQVHGTWLPGETRASESLQIRAASDATPHTARLVLSVTTEAGGLWQFEFTIALIRSTDFQLIPWSTGVREDPPGGNGDRYRGPGETVVPWLRLKNLGLVTATNVVVTLSTDDPDVTVVDGAQTIAAWPRLLIAWANEFALAIADDATAHEVTMDVTLVADYADPQHHTFAFDIATAPAKFGLRNAWVWDPEPGANHDGQVNPGERVFPRVRIKNTGHDAARNVHAVLSIVDDDITVVNGIVTHDEWPGGEARNNNGFVIDIASDATSHDVQAVVSVTADDVGPWQFAVTIPIVAPEVVATALLANYPNPFNPETWIPFDLSEAADVTVSVYDARGVIVRRLDLGRLAPGTYRSRSTAAYWDGRNDFGERVSSGMYVYELRADASRQMRKMIVRK